MKEFFTEKKYIRSICVRNENGWTMACIFLAVFYDDYIRRLRYFLEVIVIPGMQLELLMIWVCKDLLFIQRPPLVATQVAISRRMHRHRQIIIAPRDPPGREENGGRSRREDH